MKREIKFRAWDLDEKEMINGDSLAFGLYKPLCELLKSNEHQVYMQYTGLKDKNGKEIYESDIIKVLSTGQTKEVIYHKCAFSIKVTDEIIAPIYWHDDIEVIGNIHENKDLL